MQLRDKMQFADTSSANVFPVDHPFPTDRIILRGNYKALTLCVYGTPDETSDMSIDDSAARRMADGALHGPHLTSEAAPLPSSTQPAIFPADLLEQIFFDPAASKSYSLLDSLRLYRAEAQSLHAQHASAIMRLSDDGDGDAQDAAGADGQAASSSPENERIAQDGRRLLVSRFEPWLEELSQHIAALRHSMHGLGGPPGYRTDELGSSVLHAMQALSDQVRACAGISFACI